QDAESLALRHFAERVTEIRRIDGAVDQTLRQHGLVADDSELDFIALGNQAPMIQRQHGKRPYAAADALNADKLSSEIGGRRNLRRHEEIAVEFIDNARDEGEIETGGHGA